jgi:hypothetical protein
LKLFGSPRLSELERRLEKAEGSVSQLRLELEETLDKVHRWMQRARARGQVDSAPASLDVPLGAPPAPSGLDPVSQRILQQRMRRVVVPRNEEEG